MPTTDWSLSPRQALFQDATTEYPRRTSTSGSSTQHPAPCPLPLSNPFRLEELRAGSGVLDRIGWRMIHLDGAEEHAGLVACGQRGIPVDLAVSGDNMHVLAARRHVFEVDQ